MRKSSEQFPRNDLKHITTNGGMNCPFCGGNDTESVAGPGVDAELCLEDLKCRDCYRSWRNVYSLLRYEGLDESGNVEPVVGKGQPGFAGISAYGNVMM